ncbi:MAG: acylphosphatase [Alkalibacterium sp.]|nr:acylphosphatase [Alkalibacterium sp.]
MGSIFNDFLAQRDNNSKGEIIYTNDSPKDTATQKIRAELSGRVQGVGFRFSTKQAADELGVKGIVRNEADGTVYVEATSDKKHLDQFIELLRKGPSPAAVVEKVVVTYDEKIEEKSNFSQVN